MKILKCMKCIDGPSMIGRLGTLCAILMLAASSSPAQAGESVTLAWDPSPDSSVGGYFVYYGVVGRNLTNLLDAGYQTAGTVSNLVAGSTEFFFVTAYNRQRVESLPSNLITYTVPGVNNNTPPTISSIPGRTINEDTQTGAISFTVADAELTAGSLSVSGSSSNPTLVPDGNIVFAGSGANRTIAVTPAANQSGTATITVTVSDGQSSASTTFVLTVNPVNDPPTISSIANQTIILGAPLGAIAFTVGDSDTALTILTLSGNSSNPTLVPNANIVFGGSGANRTVTVTPVAAQVGTATITVTVSDGSASTNRSFAITVVPNTPPTISSIPNQVIAEYSATPPVPFVIGDAETPATSLVLSKSSSNPTLVPINNIVFGGSGANRTVTATPANNQFGTATITVTVSDGIVSTSKSFLLTVNSAPAPTFYYLSFEAESGTIVSPMAVASDPNARQGQFIESSAEETGTATFTVNIPLSGVYSIWCRVLAPNDSQKSFYVSVDGGAEDIYDAASPATFTNAWQWTVLNGRGGTNSANPLAINPRTLLLSAGPHNITFRGREAGTGFDQMLVTNDRNFVPDAVSNTAPAISGIPNQVITANTATPPIPFVIGDAETPATSLVLSKSSSNPTLVPNNNIVFGGSGTNRTVRVTPAANQSGTATITVTVSDGITSASKSFLLTVVSALGVPTFVYLPIEAESATIASPMAVASDPNAGQGQFIQSSTDELGAATFTVNVPLSGVYSIWCRVLSASDGQDSFYVSVDGGAEDIFDTAEGTWTNAWQWTVLNGRGGTNSANPLAINPRTFLLSAGPHNITFRGREAGTGFDQMLLTNDRNFVPNAIYSSAAPPFRISSLAFDPAGFVTLTWPTQPGKTYRVVYKTNLANSAWISLGKDVTATGTITSQSDYLVGNRFYGILQAP